MTREQRDGSPEHSKKLTRRAFLHGAGGLAAGIMLAGCDIPGIHTDQDAKLLTPEEMVERDFETYIRQVGNGIITRLGSIKDARYEDPREQRGVNAPDDYRWSQGVGNGPMSETGEPVELGVTLEYTENLGYQADGFELRMVVVSPTSNPESHGKTGYFVQVHARPERSMDADINRMIADGNMSVLDIATMIMQQQSGVEVRTSVDLCTLDDDPTDNLGDAVGGEDLSGMDSRGFDSARSADEKKAVFDRYVTALEPLKKQAEIA